MRRTLRTSVGATAALLTICLSAAIGAEDAPSAGRFTGPRDWFTLRGVDASHFAMFRPGQPVDLDEVEPLLKVLYQMRRFEPSELEGWGHDSFDPAQLARDLKETQGEIYLVSGRVRALETLEPVPEIAEQFDMPHYYRCQFALDRGGEAIVYAVDVPKAWREEAAERGGKLDARAGALGAYLKPSGGPEAPTPVFAAAHVAWYPGTELGNLGFDYGLFDQVEPRRPPEREPFYQMLRAVNRARPGQLHEEAEARLHRLVADLESRENPLWGVSLNPRKDRIARGKDDQWRFSVIPLFLEWTRTQGELVELTGVARQVQKVVIDDEAVRRRFGLTHYFQVAVFTDDSGVNPVFFCVPELPKGMPVGDSERYGEAVRVSGFFLKLWSYRIDIPRGADEDDKVGLRRQPAPLLIGRDLVWYPATSAPKTSMLSMVFMVILFAAVVFVSVSLWQLNRQRSAARRGAPEKITMPDDTATPDESEIDSRKEPS